MVSSNFILIFQASKSQWSVWYPTVNWFKNSLHPLPPGKADSDEINKYVNKLSIIGYRQGCEEKDSILWNILIDSV